MEEAGSRVSEVPSDKNTTPPLVTPQTTAVGGIWDSDVDAVVNKDMNQNRE